MTKIEAKQQINTFKEAKDLKSWLSENRDNMNQSMVAYGFYRLKIMDPDIVSIKKSYKNPTLDPNKIFSGGLI